VTVDQATENVAKLLHEIKRTDVPFHVGASAPLYGAITTASYAHGKDGFGDTGLPPAPAHVQPHPTPAAEALVQLLKESPGKHTLVLLGPHTNLAHALTLEPKLHQYVKKMIFLGGNTTGLGNITAAVRHAYVCMWMWTRVCMYVFMCVFMYMPTGVCMCMYVVTSVHTHRCTYMQC
jgi:inosine-uridine nucleoside N-ribohydrolase